MESGGKSVWARILSVSRGAKTGWVDHTLEFSLDRIIVNTIADLFQQFAGEVS